MLDPNFFQVDRIGPFPGAKDDETIKEGEWFITQEYLAALSVAYDRNFEGDTNH